MNRKEVLDHIEQITQLHYNAHGEEIHPAEQLKMIRNILNRYKKTRG
jgi:20S proteasome alpha/beta subunit